MPGISVKMLRGWVEMLIFTTSYLEPCNWPDAISRWIRQRNRIKFCTNIGKCKRETLAIIMKTLGKEAV
jgi:hypothetical protein